MIWERFTDSPCSTILNGFKLNQCHFSLRTRPGFNTDFGIDASCRDLQCGSRSLPVRLSASYCNTTGAWLQASVWNVNPKSWHTQQSRVNFSSDYSASLCLPLNAILAFLFLAGGREGCVSLGNVSSLHSTLPFVSHMEDKAWTAPVI